MTKITFIPTRDLVVFPGAIMPLYIGDPVYAKRFFSGRTKLYR